MTSIWSVVEYSLWNPASSLGWFESGVSLILFVMILGQSLCVRFHLQPSVAFYHFHPTSQCHLQICLPPMFAPYLSLLALHLNPPHSGLHFFHTVIHIYSNCWLLIISFIKQICEIQHSNHRHLQQRWGIVEVHVVSQYYKSKDLCMKTLVWV